MPRELIPTIESVEQLGVSVVICCFNSASRISNTLKYLSKQRIFDTISWEIILVDNASSDNTREIAATFWRSLNTSINLRIVQEHRLGLSYARESGIAEANFSIIIFCDDDNLFCDTYIQTAFRIMTENTSIGVCGGWCEADVEVPFDKWMIPFLPALAVGKPYSKSMYLGKIGKCVNGAGMVIRNQYYQNIKNKGFRSLLEDRKQNILSSGGDTELCWAMMYAGYEIYFDEVLYFKHLIPPTRLTNEYLLKLTLSSLYPVILLSIYSFVHWTYPARFSNFFLKEIINRIYAIFYYLPRMVFGKYPFYCSVVFRQNLKTLWLLISKFSNVKSDFNRIRDLKQRLSKDR